jgi:hypothetical protein
MKHSTNMPITVIKRIGKGAYAVYNDCYVSYDSNIKTPISESVSRINENGCSAEMSKHLMIFKSSAFENADDETNLKQIIPMFSGEDPIMILECNHRNEKIIDVSVIKKTFVDLQKSFGHRPGDPTDYNVIYQGIDIPVNIKDLKTIEIYNNDFGIFGINEYSDFESYLDMKLDGTIYHVRCKFKISDVPIDAKHGLPKHILFVGKDSDGNPYHKFMLSEINGFSSGTFEEIRNTERTLDVFFRPIVSETDSLYLDTILIIEPVNTNTCSGPKDWVVKNERTGKETTCSLSGGKNFKYPSSLIINFAPPKFNKIIYRPHRGSLADALAEAEVFYTIEDMFKHIVAKSDDFIPGLFNIDDLRINEDIGPEDRTGWPNYHYVTTVAYGDKRYPEPGMCIGMCCFINDDDALNTTTSNTEHEKSKESIEDIADRINKCADRIDACSNTLIKFYDLLNKLLDVMGKCTDTLCEINDNMENRKDET